MVYIFQLTNDEIIDILDLKFIPTTSIGFTLPSGINMFFLYFLMLKSSLPNEVKVNTTNHDVTLKSNLATNKTTKFSKKIFFYKNLDFNQSHSCEIGDIESFVLLIP